MQGNSYITVIAGRKSNLCTVLMKAKVDPYLSKFIKSVGRYSKVFNDCPIPLVRSFYKYRIFLKNYYIDAISNPLQINPFSFKRLYT